MRRIIRKLVPVVFLLLSSLSSLAAEFVPTPLVISAPDAIIYEFGGANIEIPITVSGTDAYIIFAVFTNGLAEEKARVTNGYLGWHYVNSIDTCVYNSWPQNYQKGANVYVWDGRDQERKAVLPGTYTYYLWGYDGFSAKTQVTRFITPYGGTSPGVIDTDTNGLPLANPIIYDRRVRWRLGDPPGDDSYADIIDYPDTTTWRWADIPTVNPKHPDRFYVRVTDPVKQKGAIAGYRWIPNGVPELLADFGSGGISGTFDDPIGRKPNVAADSRFLYTTNGALQDSTKSDAAFHVYDFNGNLVRSMDIADWWSSPGEGGGYVNMGPTHIGEKNGKLFLNSRYSCIQQMIDPAGVLESDGWDDMLVWSNGNGDYIFDRNFEDTAQRPWVCMDRQSQGIYNGLWADSHLFSIGGVYDLGNVSFGILFPDGTGGGYAAIASESYAKIPSYTLLDNGTAFDGLYSDNLYPFYLYKPAKEASYVVIEGRQYQSWSLGTYFLAQNTFHGTLKPADRYLFIQAPTDTKKYEPGDTYVITWQQHGVESIDIEWSPDKEHWERIADNVNASSGSFVWTIPVKRSVSSIWIRVVASGDDAIVSETDTALAFIPAYLRVREPKPVAVNTLYPNNAPIRIQWLHTYITTVTLAYSLDEGKTWQQIAKNVPAGDEVHSLNKKTGSYDWNPPAIDTPGCLIRVSADNGDDVSDVSASIRVGFPELSVKSPINQYQWSAGSEQDIRWNADGPEKIDIYLSRDNGKTWQLIAKDIATGLETYSWKVTSPGSDSCFIRLAVPGSEITATSRRFMISEPYVKLQSPVSGSALAVRYPYALKWDQCGGNYLSIALSYDNGESWVMLAEHYPSGNRSFSLILPDDAEGTVLIRITDETYPDVFDTCGPFVIINHNSVQESPPYGFHVGQNTPNPFNASTTIPFVIPERGAVRAEVFSLAGQRVALLADSELGPGHHALQWNPGDCSAGLYFCRIAWRNHTEIRKMMLVK